MVILESQKDEKYIPNFMQKNTNNISYANNSELVQQIQQGQRQAEKTLVKKYWRNLNLILFKRTGDLFLAEDLCQETFIVVIKKAREGAIKEPAALASFMHGVAVKLLSAHYKKEHRRATEADENIIDYEDKTPGIFQLLSAGQRLNAVKEIINSLSAERDILLLQYYFIYQKEKTEICMLLNLTPEHFDRVIYRAKQRLREKMDQILDTTDSEASISRHSSLVIGLLLISAIYSSDSDFKKNPFLLRDISGSHHLVNKSPGFSLAVLSIRQFMGE